MLASQGQAAHTSIEGTGDGAPSILPTPARNLMVVAEEIANIELPVDHPAPARLAATQNYLQTIVVQQP